MMTNTDSHIIEKKQCPECKKKGKDRSHDNLAVYSDGHEYCYSCGYHLPANRLKSFKRREREDNGKDDEKIVRLPSDSLPLSHAPAVAKRWLDQYELTPNQLVSSNIMWSEKRQRLIFPYFINGTLVAWQGRWFGKENAPKWFTDGKVEDILYIRGPQKGTIVLTEDVISAIKVGSHIAATPIFGSVISTKKFKQLHQVCDKVIIWLDPDKQKEAVKFANIGRLFGLDCHVILSDKDPKEHSNEEIKNYLSL